MDIKFYQSEQKQNQFTLTHKQVADQFTEWLQNYFTDYIPRNTHFLLFQFIASEDGLDAINHTTPMPEDQKEAILQEVENQVDRH